MTKRYLGNIITQNPTPPADNTTNTPAPGVWSLSEALFYTKAGLWPNAANLVPAYAMVAGFGTGTVPLTLVMQLIPSNSGRSLGVPQGVVWVAQRGQAKALLTIKRMIQ
jgi:hypothetical protein